jgi:hypothetical protein
MDRQRPVLILLIALFVLVACAPAQTGSGGYVPGPDVNAAQATYAAAVAQATAQARTDYMQATAVAAQSTAVAQSTRDMVTLTADAVSLRITMQAVDASSTRESIASNATATAVARVAQMEQRLIDDEAMRLSIQREKERVQIRNDELWAAIWPVLVVALAFVGAVLALAMAYGIYQRTRPIIIRRSETAEPDVLIHSNGGWRQLTAPRRMEGAGLLEAGTAVNGVRELPSMPDGHVLIAGPTHSGKSTALRAIAKTRENIVVLDPHHRPGDWPNAQVIGGGRNFDAIAAFMAYMMDELNDRAQMMSVGDVIPPPMTVITDEMPAIAAALGQNTSVVWQSWLREGWKFGLFFIVGTQSLRVKTLGIEGQGDVLQNFANTLVLGKLAREEFPELVGGLERPAVLMPSHEPPYPVVIPYNPTEDPKSGAFGQAGGGPAITRPAPPQNNLPRPITQAERDGRLLEPYLDTLTSPTNAGRKLGELKGMLAEGVNPSAEMIEEARSALEWRVRNLGCDKAQRVLDKARTRVS